MRSWRARIIIAGTTNPLNLFSKSTDTETFADGEVIFSQGEPGENFYVVRGGEVEIQCYGVSVDTVDTVGEGSIIGEMAPRHFRSG